MASARETVRSNLASTRPPRILNVDDNEPARYAVTRILQQAGFEVEEVSSGAEALRAARLSPDIIILDIKMPDLDGLEVCRRLKDDAETALIPVLHLTATYASTTDWAAALEAGADAYLSHPVEPVVLIATVRSLLRARAAEAEVRAAVRTWQNTFDAITAGVAVLDADLRIRQCNRSMALFLGRTPEELVGADGMAPLPGAVRPPEGWPSERARVSHQRESQELQLGDRWYEVVSDPVRDERGEFGGVVRIVTDVTERKRAEAEKNDLLHRERSARNEAEAASRLKDEFLATLSHELRTPLHAIMGWAQVLRSSWPDPTTFQRAVDTIERNARAQEQLVSDILDVSRIVAGKLRLDTQPVDLGTVVEAAVGTVTPTAEAKGVRLESAIQRGTGAVLGDRDRLQQVAWNLLSNAIKFTPAGGRVTARVTRVGNEMELVVEDTGAGMEPALLPHVFERFRQADSSTTRKHGGLGLGLALVRHLVEQHGGTTFADSQGLGKGSLFVVRLPVFAAAPPIAGDRGSDAAEKTPLLTGVRVVLVEDDTDAREGLALLLQGRGARVTSVASAREAFEALLRDVPDVLVADIGMPEENGYELIRKVRGHENRALGRVPAIALSGYATPNDRAQALMEGYDLHLAKPLHIPELVVGISSRVRSHAR